MTITTKRPYPPAALFGEDLEGAYARAEEVEEWLRRAFIESGGTFFSETHEPLADAYIGVLWATKEVRRKGLTLAGQAEMPQRSVGHMNGHVKEIWLWQMRRWFGPQLPDFLVTLNAKHLGDCGDVEFAATVKHELMHCDQALDEFGSRRFKRDGSRVWTIKPHDVETFVEVAEDFGPVERGVRDLMTMLSRPPRFGAAQIEIACGTCLARAA